MKFSCSYCLSLVNICWKIYQIIGSKRMCLMVSVLFFHWLQSVLWIPFTPIFCAVSAIASRFRRYYQRVYIHYQMLWVSCCCLVRLFLCVVSCDRIVPWFKFLDRMHLPEWNTGKCKLWRRWQLYRQAMLCTKGRAHASPHLWCSDPLVGPACDLVEIKL